MYAKVTNPFAINRLIFAIFLAVIPLSAKPQDSVYIRPAVTSKWKEYSVQVLHDSTKKMVELKSVIPNLVYELRYAGTDNFMRRRMYPAHTTQTFLRYPAAEALQRVNDELAKLGFGLKVFDAYRPFSVTVKFWELVKDERYVANPSKGSGHNRGIAIDLTIIEIKTGKELEMGTGFDNFSDTAHHSFLQLNETVLANRQLLRRVMEKNGFTALETEWWHYFLTGGSRFELLDLGFDQLRNGH